MSEKKVWLPFGDMEEENPFHFEPARVAMKNAIQLAWTATPEWIMSPVTEKNIEMMEARLRVLLEDLLKEVREAADREHRRNPQ